MSRGLYYKKKLFRIFLFLLAFILLSHLPLYADDAVSSEPIGEVEVTAKPIESDTIPEKPTSFGSIINLEKERVRFIELRDILDSEAGLHVRRFGGTGSLSTVEIRGVSSKGILVMIDGVPLNGLWATGVDLSTIPLSGFEKIEVLRGGGGAFYGDSALGGAINLLTSKEKTAINHTTASVGSFGLIQNKSLFMSRCGNEDVLVALEGSGSMGDFEFANDNGTSLDRSLSLGRK